MEWVLLAILLRGKFLTIDIPEESIFLRRWVASMQPPHAIQMAVPSRLTGPPLALQGQGIVI